MTSSAARRRGCYVHVVLPGAVDFVTAGRFELDEDGAGVPVGRFVYGRSYRDRPDAVAIDPGQLALAPTTWRTTRLGGMFGALRDAGPDHWGRQVIARRAGKPGLGEIDYLLGSPDDRAGALGFGTEPAPPPPSRGFNGILDLGALMELADAVIAGEDVRDGPAAELVGKLLQVDTSMGGARPKNTVEDGEGLWLAKFNRAEDGWNHARVEHAMLELARACGLDAARSRIETVGGRDALLVKRFDREKAPEGYLRARMVSGLTILRAGDAHGDRDRWSYLLLAEELRRLSSDPKRDAAELFRRMAFNALVSNTDDHPRNHAAIAWDGGWRLSPAYDLTPSTPVSVERRDLAMACGDAGRHANAQNLLSQHARFGLERDQAEAIVDRMEERVAGAWRETARRAGVSRRDRETISGAFAYEGFRL